MKKIIDKLFHAAHRRYGEHGSALLVSLMVMVGLSLLGLSFVAISETETAISAHERDSNQTLDAAEAGAKMVVEWFQDPDWAAASVNSLLPPNDATIKTQRRFISNGNTVQNYYKQDTSLKLFDKPFAQTTDLFFGTETQSDVVINYTTTVGRNFLTAINRNMFTNNTNVQTGSPQNTEGGFVRITEIRVFAPPIIGGNLNGNGFWDNVGVPYGLATIKVTASKFGPKDNNTTDLSTAKPLSTRFVKIIVAPWPFPGPQGPIQSNANISTGGGVGVHWGRMTAEGDMEIKRPWTALNWFDAWDRPHFEHGYDSSDTWQAGRAYALGETVHPTGGPTLTNYAYVCTTAGTSAVAASEPGWVANAATSTVTITDNTVTWTRRPRMSWPNTATGTAPEADRDNWLWQLIGKTYEDPWFEARARGTISNAQSDGATGDQPYPYDLPTLDPVNQPQSGFSSWFQNQVRTDPKPSRMKQVVFPRIDYNFWKDIALSGAGTQGVYYLQWVSGDLFTNGVTTKKMAKWVNTVTGAPPGFYFFETQNKQNPQGPGAPGVLTPDISLNSGDDGNTFQMAGFIYLNCGFGTTGLGGPAGYQNYPGEPFRDVGFRLAAEATVAAAGGNPAQTKGQFFVDNTGSPVISSSGDGGWLWQDLEWSNSGTDGTGGYGTSRNGKFDVFLKQRTVRLADGTTPSLWLPVEWYPGCHPGTNASLPADALGCSEPHEPYLNLQYFNNSGISQALGNGNRPKDVTVGWYAPGSEDYLSKKTVNGAPIGCSSANPTDECTSNGYDRDGPLVNDIEPILNGVLYIEGDMVSQGNAPYYGSVLINGSVDNNGTPDVWFDESLIKNTWPPSSLRFPRVYVSAVQTDQQ